MIQYLGAARVIWEAFEWRKMLQLIREVPEWINYNNEILELVQSLKNRLERLDCLGNDVEEEVKIKEHQTGKKRKREVDNWLKNVRSKVDDMQNVENQIRGVNHLSRFIFREWLQGELKTKIQEVDEFLEQGKFSERPLVEATQTKLELPVGKEIAGQDTAKKISRIFDCLRNPRILRIGVVGVEGIGKSFILIHIHNRLLVMTDSFDCVYYVNVAEDNSPSKLQASIAKAMELEMNDTDTTKRAGVIYSALRTKRFVLILDGLSISFSMDEVGIPLEENKGKLILTTRLPLVCQRMCCQDQEVIELKPFPYRDAEIFFKKQLGQSIPCEIRNIAEKIIRKCDGIPSRLKNMAVKLRGVCDIHEWRSTLYDMECD